MQDYGLWVEHYRPRTIEDVVLPTRLKDQFISVIEQQQIMNMTFDGGPGIGKTTTARILCEMLNLDYIVINSSEQGQIDTLRSEIRQFASTVSIVGVGIKVVVLDEADGMTKASQEALKGFIEEFPNCRFILTTNNSARILPAIISRCPIICCSPAR